MTSKTILVLAIATAFIAGTLTTGTLVFADEKTLVERCDKQAGKDNFKGLVCSAIFELQNQIDNISQGVQVDQQGNTVLSNDLEVIGDTRLGDTTISSDLIIGPTNIDSETGDVDVGGDLNVIGETFLDDTTISTTLTVGTTTIDDATSNVDVGGDLLCNGCIDSSDIADGTITVDKMSSSFMKFVRLADDTTGNTAGWNPDGSTKLFEITESSIVHTGSKASVVAISLHDVDFSISSIPTCSVTNISNGGPFKIGCNNAPTDGAILSYVVLTP